MPKLVKLAKVARRVIPPISKGSPRIVGKSGPLALRARDGVAWVRKGSTAASVSGLPERVRRAIPWLLGGSIAWELGDQLFSIERGGKIIDEEGSPITSLSDACYNLHDHMRDKNRLKSLVTDLVKVRAGISNESDQTFIQTMISGDRYTLDEEAATLVLMYQARREMVKKHFLFTPEGLASAYFNDLYVGCYNPTTGFIEEPQTSSWEGISQACDEAVAACVDEKLVTDVIRQFVDLDGFLKLVEFRERVVQQGGWADSSLTPSAPDVTGDRSFLEIDPNDTDPLHPFDSPVGVASEIDVNDWVE